MNEYELFDAIGGVDEDLLRRTEQQPTRRLPVRKFFIAAAAVMLLAVTVIAAPVISELLFPSSHELISEGTVIRRTDGTAVVYADMYQIDFELHDTSSLPTTFEEYMIPGFFEEQGWYQDYGYSMTDINRYPSVEYMWLPYERSSSWVIFEQAVFHQDTTNTPIGSKQFFLPVPPDFTVIEETMQIDGSEITAFLADSGEGYSERHIYWTDGRYAYYLNATMDIEPEQLAQIITSLAPVDDPSAYMKDGERMMMLPLPPIGTYYTLSELPEGFCSTVCEVEDSEATWEWARDEQTITLSQTTHTSINADLANYEYYGWLVEEEEIQLEDVTVYIATLKHGCAALWESDDNYFDLTWAGSSSITKDDLIPLIQALSPVDDIEDYLTE